MGVKNSYRRDYKAESLEVAAKLKRFIKGFGGGNEKQFAHQCGFLHQSVYRWSEDTAMPAWALVRLVRQFPAALEVFFPGLEGIDGKRQPIARSAGQWASRLSLIREVIDLMEEADEETVVALKGTIKIFWRGVESKISKVKEGKL